MKTKLEDLFWPHVGRTRGGAYRCWEWTGIIANRDTNPVPVIWNGAVYVTTANRVSVKLHSGRYPRRPLRHSCGNGWCVNPRHLYEAGT
jgi:hypothetical protein